MKKRVALLLCALLLATALFACGNEADKPQENDSKTEEPVTITFARVESLDIAGRRQTEGDNVIYDHYNFEAVDSDSIALTSFYSETLGKKTTSEEEPQSYVPCLKAHTVVIPQTLLGKTVVAIRAEAFRYHTEIETLVIPETVTEIGEFAFAECNTLKSLTLPAAVENLGVGAFCKCGSMETLTFAESSALSFIPQYCFMDCSSLKEVHIPAYIEVVGFAAFLNCTSVTTLTLEEGLTVIESQAFQNMNLAETPAIPSTVTSVGDLIF